MWPDFFYPHKVLIADNQGRGTMGVTYAERRESIAEVIDEQSLVRDASGAEVVSSTRVTVPLEPHVPLGSKVTVWPGGTAERTAVVLRVGRGENALPLDAHQILWLT